MSVQSCDLQVARVFADVRIVKRADRVRLVQRAVVEHVIEDHGDTERPDLQGFCRFVGQREAQDKFALVHGPGSCHLQRKVEW